MPKLRFKNNIGEDFEMPDDVTIADVFDKVKKTNKDGQNKNVITNSAEFGLIPQREFFDKDIAVEGNTDKYTIIEKGDFVYNPRKSSAAPYGPFNCYNCDEIGIVSPLYSCLKPKDHNLTPYLLHYFSSPAWYSYIYHNGNQGGARHDRVGMTDDLLMGIPVLLPCKEEQKKITEFLALYDKKIIIQREKVKALETRRKGLLQQIFSQEIRFTADDGSKFDDWEDTEIGTFLQVRNEKQVPTSEAPLKAFIANVGVSDKGEKYDRSHLVKNEDKKYKRTELFDFIYSSNNLDVGSIGLNTYGTAVISDVYEIFKIIKEIEPMVLNYAIKKKETINNIILFRQGCLYGQYKIYPEDFLSVEISVPTSLDEQKKISAFFHLIDKQIQIEKDKLEAIKIIKKGLLQQMFI